MIDEEARTKVAAPYVPILDATERAAYAAAFQIENKLWGGYGTGGERQYYFESTRRSKTIDTIAKIIQESMEQSAAEQSRAASECRPVVDGHKRTTPK
jgi:hypothetical protein